MSWVGYAILVAVGLFVGRTIAASRRLKEANARADEPPALTPKKKKRKKKQSSTALALTSTTSTSTSTPAPADANAAPQIPATWGWAKLSLGGADLKALGYYYRDKQAGYSFKILVDLKIATTEAAIRDAARAADYFANTTFRLGAHDTSYLQAMGDDMRAKAELEFESGTSPIGEHCAMVHMLTREQREAYALPTVMPHMEAYL